MATKPTNGILKGEAGAKRTNPATVPSPILNANKAAIAAATAPATSGTLPSQSDSAYQTLKATLDQYGLGDLADFAWKQYQAGVPDQQIFLNIRDTPTYKQRFPGMDTLRQQGRNWTEAQYLSYEQSAREVFQKYGLPAALYDQPQDFANLITGNVSVNELDNRVSLAEQASQTGDPETRARLKRVTGLTDGDLTAYYLDPTKALPLLNQQFQAAQIGGDADRAGYSLTDPQAAALAQQGITDAQAQKGFTDLGSQSQLFTGLAGTTEGGIDQSVQLGAEFGGNAADQEAINQRAAERKAQFTGQTNYAATGSGTAGLATQR